MIRKIDDRISVSPQIRPEDVSDIAALGFVAIVNNRPDHEEHGQPDGTEIAVAAEAAGLAYTAIPVTHEGYAQAQVEAMKAVLDATDGPVLAYCRSGTRSCSLWALAQAFGGGDADELVEKGAGAGYDLYGMREVFKALAAQA